MINIRVAPLIIYNKTRNLRISLTLFRTLISIFLFSESPGYFFVVIPVSTTCVVKYNKPLTRAVQSGLPQ